MSASMTPPASPSRSSCPDENRQSAIAFLHAAVTFLQPATASRQPASLSDNGSCYRSHALPRPSAISVSKHRQDQALYAEDQWQGRALHPDRPARMGLRSRLYHLSINAPRAADLAASLQLASSPRRTKVQTTYQSPRSDEDNLLRLHS